MVPSDFPAIPLTLAQTPNQPAVPGAAGVAPTTPSQGVAAPTGPAGPAPAGNPFGGLIWMLPVLLLVMVVMPSLGNKKQKKIRETMIASLKRNDRVLTTAGIIGSIAELRDTEVVIRVDEASDTRICFAKSAIQQVLREGKDGARADVEVKPKAETANAR